MVLSKRGVSARLCSAAVSVVLSLPVYFAGAAPAGEGKTALDHLRAAPKPRFREGHTLLPLTRWGWTMPFEVRVELAENWGYALEFGGYATAGLVKKLEDPESTESKICGLAAKDPRAYPLCVITDHPCNRKEFVNELPPQTWSRNEEGDLAGGKKVWSPEAPDEVFERAAARAVEPLKRIREKAPVAMILNGGEYALGVYGFGGKHWKQDPRVMAAKGGRGWFEYVSERKAHQELIISNAFRAALPDRKLFIYYHTSGCPHRNRYGHWWHWAWDYKHMRRVSDLPNSSIYFKHYNSGWTGGNDMLTQALNAVARSLQFEEPLSYNWLNAGWTRKKLGDEAFSDPEHYMGYLKCYYTAGMIGGVAGYFSYPRPKGFAGEVGDEPPSWLWQMTVLARAHALFSHLEHFLRDGDLLPGPDRHRWTKDVPAYEFPASGAEGVPDARVLARRHRRRREWLVTAWAAGGEDREVSVTIPGLGEATVLARDCGSVYRATLRAGRPVLTLIDKDGMLPASDLR